MDDRIPLSVRRQLGKKIVSSSRIGGGCINETFILKTESNKEYFLKINSDTPKDMFHVEAEGLSNLATTNTIRIPKVIEVHDDFLLLERIKSSRKNENFFQSFGKAFARHHKTRASAWGWPKNNYIGTTQQKNTPIIPYQKNSREKDWCQFYFEYRLLYQVRLLEKKGNAGELSKLMIGIEGKIQKILEGPGEPPAILHGDLWGGNYMVDETGSACLIDPAVYWGHREADLAMTKLFGGFPHEFYRAYNDEYPLKPGWEYRENLYKLYHVLNHLNLFGHSYYSQSVNLARFYL